MALTVRRPNLNWRERAYFRDRADFLNRLPNGIVAVDNFITVSSDYFMATLRVTYGSAAARGTALLARETSGWPAIVWRKIL